jgi:hypothetical protein
MNAFEAWLAHLFDRRPDELGSPAWYHLTAWADETAEQPTEWTIRYEENDTPVAKAERILRLFSDAGALLRPYSDEQVGHGLNYIVNPAVDGDIRVLAKSAEDTAEEVPAALRAAGMRSIVTLFAEVFAPRLGAPDPGAAGPWGYKTGGTLDFICYMFWDVAAIRWTGDPIVLEVLEATAALDSPACQRAALHGLGHECQYARDQVRGIVHRWLETHPDAPEELRAYAAQAAHGRVQ